MHPGAAAGLLRTWQQQLTERCQQQLLGSGASSYNVAAEGQLSHMKQLGRRAEHVIKHLKQKAIYSQAFGLIATVNKMIL